MKRDDTKPTGALAQVLVGDAGEKAEIDIPAAMPS